MPDEPRPSMPILPDFARILIVAYLEPVLHWVSEQIYAELLKWVVSL